jgi:hypothetical protein
MTAEYEHEQQRQSKEGDAPAKEGEGQVPSVQLKGTSYAQGKAALSPGAAGGFETQQAALKPPPLQMKGGSVQKKDIHEIAAQGTRGSGSALPHGDAIQAAFGRHDVSGVQAHTGGAAAEANKSMGAEAYASGNNIAFKGAPDLHTAAHEAAHIVQQRGGVSLDGGVGKAGDSYEKHADSVADSVVSGQNAEGLLDQMAGGASGGSVQAKSVQFEKDPDPVHIEFGEDEGSTITTDVYKVDASKAESDVSSGGDVDARIGDIVDVYSAAYLTRIRNETAAMEQIADYVNGVDFSAKNADLLGTTIKFIALKGIKKGLEAIPVVGNVASFLFDLGQDLGKAHADAIKATKAANWEDWLGNQRLRITETGSEQLRKMVGLKKSMIRSYGQTVAAEDSAQGATPADREKSDEATKNTGRVFGAGATFLKQHEAASRAFQSSSPAMTWYVENILSEYIGKGRGTDTESGPGIHYSGFIYLDLKYLKDGNSWELVHGPGPAKLEAPGKEKLVKGLNWLMDKTGKSILDLPIHKHLDLKVEKESFGPNSYDNGVVKWRTNMNTAYHVEPNYDVSRSKFNEHWQFTKQLAEAKLRSIRTVEPY